MQLTKYHTKSATTATNSVIIYLHIYSKADLDLKIYIHVRISLQTFNKAFSIKYLTINQLFTAILRINGAYGGDKRIIQGQKPINDIDISQ